MEQSENSPFADRLVMMQIALAQSMSVFLIIIIAVVSLLAATGISNSLVIALIGFGMPVVMAAIASLALLSTRRKTKKLFECN